MKTILSAIKKPGSRYVFLSSVVITVVLALRFPGIGVALGQWPVLKVAIFVCFLITGLTLQTSRLLDEIRNFKVIATALVSCFVLFPLLALLVGRLTLPTGSDLQIGLLILATMPVTIASGGILTQMAHGNIALSLLICVGTNLIAILTIPFSLNLLLRFGRQIELPVFDMMITLALLVLLPTLVGQLLRPRFKRVIAVARPGFSIFSQLVVLLIILNAFSSSADSISRLGLKAGYVVIIMFALHIVVVAVNFGLTRLLHLDTSSTAAFTIHTSQKTLTVTFVVWSSYFAHYPLALIPATAYHLLQVVADTFLAHRFRRSIIPDHTPDK